MDLINIQGGIKVRIEANSTNVLVTQQTGQNIQKSSNVNSNNNNTLKSDLAREVKVDMQGYTELVRKPKYELSVSDEYWIQAVDRANKAVEGAMCNFEYAIHEQTKQIMVKVIDRDTKELIREIPPEKILDMVAKMWELSGIMIDERR